MLALLSIQCKVSHVGHTIADKNPAAKVETTAYIREMFETFFVAIEVRISLISESKSVKKRAHIAFLGYSGRL